MKHDMYDLVKVVDSGDKKFYGALGIINYIDRDSDENMLYGLLFVGKHHNDLDKDETPLFYADELEGI